MVDIKNILGGLNAICPEEAEKCAHAIPASLGGHAEALAGLAAPRETMGAEDFFYLMAHPDEIDTTAQSGDARAATLRRVEEYLGYAGLNQEGVTVSYSQITVPGKDGTDMGSIAVTRIRPDNVDDQKAPIVFAGGLFHKTPVYFDFLRQLAIRTGREIAAFDSPGNGASQYDVKSQTFPVLTASIPLVIKAVYGDGCPVVVMGHSLGTFSERDLFYRQELQDEPVVNNHVEKYIFIAPQPDLIRERAHGLTIALPFMLDGMATMATNHQVLLPGKRATHFYFNTHSPDEQQWLLDMTQDRWPVTYLNYSALLLGVMREPLLPEIGNNPKLKFVLMDQDHVFPTFRNEEFWQERALILPGDHSTIVGRNVDPALVEAIAALIED